MKRATASDTAREYYRGLLTGKRAALLAGFGPRFDAAAKREQFAEEDQAQISHDEFVSLKLNSLDYVRLRHIDEALDRLEAGDYGICLNCEARIPPNRLAALPWARYCVACQQEVGANEEREMLEARPRVPMPPR